ncbi:MAG: YfhO family protein [Candidatus Levybacteria bacterium]|nr:YfhO family protein [Candidatus Levybacteria bacterium]
MKFKIQKFLLKTWPLLVLVIIWFIFASPYFLQNRVPFTSTYQVNNFAPWSAYPEFWGPVKNGAMPDVITQIYPWKYFTIDTLKSGQVPLWNPYSFSGTPHLANYQSAVFSPFNFLFFILPFIDAWSILILLQPLLAGLFMYLLIRAFNFSKLIGLISSISFMFCGFITVWMGYGTLAYAILFLPLAIFAIENYIKEKKIIFLALLSITIPLSFFSGHFQMSLYFLLTVVIYIFYKSIVSKNIYHALYLISYTFLGVLLSSPQLFPSIELYFQTFRSGLFRVGEIIPWEYIATFIAPDFFGNPITRNDWFGHYAEWNGYIGVLPLILSIYGLTSKKKVQTFFLFIFGIFILLLAFNTPLLTFLVNLHIPVLSTSAASRIIVVYSFLFAILAAFGLEELLVDIKKYKIKKILIWIGSFTVVFSLLWLIVVFRIYIPQDRLVVARQNLILPTGLFILVSISVLFSVLYLKKTKDNKGLILSFLSLFFLFIVSFDMLRFAIKWQAFDPKHLVFPDTKTTQEFKRISGYERVLGNLGAEALVYYKVPSIEGYDAVYIKRYGEFISFINAGLRDELWASVVIFSRDGKSTSDSINLLGIKYIIHKISDDNMGWTFPVWKYPQDRFKLVYADKHYKFFENKEVFPRVFMVGKYRVIQDDQKILSTMFSDNFNLRNEIILEKNPSIQQSEGEIGNAEIISYTPNKIKISVDTNDDGLLFLSDVYYKGWEAYVDGRKSEVYRADYIFRAVPVSKGKHTVEFTYNPLSFRVGIYSFFTGLILITIVSTVLSRRRFLK